ncbi:hypothetical protein D3C85_1706860 [compost metagenome]
MHLHNGAHHSQGNQDCRNLCEQSETKQSPSDQFHQAGYDRHSYTRFNAYRLHPASSPFRSITAEHPEQLLCPVTNEQQPDNQPNNQ